MRKVGAGLLAVVTLLAEVADENERLRDEKLIRERELERMQRKHDGDIRLSLDDIFGTSVTYGDAVKAIFNSNCSSYYKDRILDDISRNESTGYYKAVIAVMESNLDDYYKERRIRKMSI